MAGIIIIDGAVIEMKKVLLENNHYAGILMSDNFFNDDGGTTYVKAQDLVVRR